MNSLIGRNFTTLSSHYGGLEYSSVVSALAYHPAALVVMPKKAAAAKEAVLNPKPEPSRVAWPLLQPVLPACDLSLEVVIPDQILVVHKLFTASLCRRFVTFCSTLPLSTTSTIPKKNEALRFNDRLQVDDHHFAETLWSSTALKELVTAADVNWGGEVVGLNPRIRVYRYAKGHYFDQHYDESNTIILPTYPTPTHAKTTWTLLLYLTGPETGCLGGETVFYPEHGQARDFWNGQRKPQEPLAIVPEVGMALFHKHGDDCMLHEGKEVKAGYKWIVRSDLCVKR